MTGSGAQRLTDEDGGELVKDDWQVILGERRRQRGRGQRRTVAHAVDDLAQSELCGDGEVSNVREIKGRRGGDTDGVAGRKDRIDVKMDEEDAARVEYTHAGAVARADAWLDAIELETFKVVDRRAGVDPEDGRRSVRERGSPCHIQATHLQVSHRFTSSPTQDARRASSSEA
ncbi:hypothetical protein OF846_003103 [Rhodotorula toruloides]|nr:hypothetical protein OF846_003103 [Rhodotorula toruloides]